MEKKKEIEGISKASKKTQEAYLIPFLKQALVNAKVENADFKLFNSAKIEVKTLNADYTLSHAGIKVFHEYSNTGGDDLAVFLNKQFDADPSFAKYKDYYKVFFLGEQGGRMKGVKYVGLGGHADQGGEYTTSYYYEESLPNGAHLDISGNEISGYSKTIREKNSDFETYYTYDPSGHLKLIGQAYINDFSSGIRYWFSESGEIEKYEDYDAPYDFSWEDVRLFLKKYKVDKQDIHQIGRSVQDGAPLWYISFKTEELRNSDNVQQFVLNGKTGEVVKKEILVISRKLD